MGFYEFNEFDEFNGFYGFMGSMGLWVLWVYGFYEFLGSSGFTMNLCPTSLRSWKLKQSLFFATGLFRLGVLLSSLKHVESLHL